MQGISSSWGGCKTEVIMQGKPPSAHTKSSFFNPKRSDLHNAACWQPATSCSCPFISIPRRRQTQTCSGRSRLLVCLWHLPAIQSFNEHRRRRAWLAFPMQPARSRNTTTHPRAQPLPAPTGATQVIAISEIGCALSATQCSLCSLQGRVMPVQWLTRTGEGVSCVLSMSHF